MSIQKLERDLHQIAASSRQFSLRERVRCMELLLDAAKEQFNQLRKELNEDTAAARRRQSKRRETELDPKPPVKPVRVAEPSKPKKPKYSGNHASLARR